MSGEEVSGDSAALEQTAVDTPPAAPGLDARAAPEMTAPLLDVDLPPTPSIPSGKVDNDPPRPEAPLTLPPAAPPPSGQPASALEAEPASLEPPGAIAAEPMAPAPRDERRADDEQPPLAVEEVQPRADISPQPEAARAPEGLPAVSAPAASSAVGPAEPGSVADQPPANEWAIAPLTVASDRARPDDRGDVVEDVVTMVKISPAQVGGVTETPLPGNRAGSPSAPQAAPRIGRVHPLARRVVYAVVVVALALLFLWLLVDLFRVG